MPNPSPAAISPGDFAALGALVLATLLLIVFAYRRRTYIMLWSIGWALVCVATIAGSGPVNSFLIACATLLFAFAADKLLSDGAPPRPYIIGGFRDPQGVIG